jgi:two-component system, OmpR family, sensor histidine kinase BaeS
MRSTVHEMRNQLTVAVANIEAFIDGKLMPTRDRLGAVLLALNKLDALMNDLRPSARSERAATNMRPVDVCALILSETIAMEATAEAAGITLDVDICTRQHLECSRFLCDAMQVSQVIKNVLLNAIKYTGRGGRVKLYCHREPGVVALEISDSGPGVPVAERQTIFESGVRGSAATIAAGSGVGLAVVRGILDAHGGTVTVADSAIGGARFVIRLPGDTSAADACISCGDRSPLLHESVTPAPISRP